MEQTLTSKYDLMLEGLGIYIFLALCSAQYLWG
jgi:hypothetical protein